MGTNRAHRSNPREIIETILYGEPIGAVSLLILSINNFLNNEIKLTVLQNPPQTSLMFMGTHSAILTITEVIFGIEPVAGYKKFLLEFMDGDSEDRKFSVIASEIHAWRNTLVHGWLSLRGHNIDYEYNMDKGFEMRGNTLTINPKIYLDQYLQAFQNNGHLWKYIKNMSKEDLKSAQNIIKQKYLR